MRVYAEYVHIHMFIPYRYDTHDYGEFIYTIYNSNWKYSDIMPLPQRVFKSIVFNQTLVTSIFIKGAICNKRKRHGTFFLFKAYGPPRHYFDQKDQI